MDAVFLQYGAVGAVALMALFAVRVLFQRTIQTLDRETERADRLEEELRKLNEMIRDEYAASMASAAKAIGDANTVVNSVLSRGGMSK